MRPRTPVYFASQSKHPLALDSIPLPSSSLTHNGASGSDFSLSTSQSSRPIPPLPCPGYNSSVETTRRFRAQGLGSLEFKCMESPPGHHRRTV
ncbi:hypothetical protein K491DRAFT_688416 [Lophiostoma macrostomum CBS 122681]|uniref:Uncharacterized protein n=1 Tax=Lophiostoma macrostomum CBS 122681 TaxID=1314788 RepID=A0A6A6TM14_9PLEO|nr:hypothetical protein K491DRAFT_688416 [Lophiostoma macrostomum CBS 122681]